MARYYGVTRSSDYLKHYGITGMRWGVKKAIEKGDSKALAKHYRKAQRKLSQLSRRENVSDNAADAKRYGKIARNAAMIGLGGIAGSQVASQLLMKGSKAMSSKQKEAVNKWWNQINALREENPGIPDHISMNDPSALELANAERKIRGESTKLHNASVSAENVRNLIGGAGLGIAALAGGKAALHKYRTTPKGHAKAVKKRENWEQEMRQAFEGTKYGTKKKRKR